MTLLGPGEQGLEVRRVDACPSAAQERLPVHAPGMHHLQFCLLPCRQGGGEIQNQPVEFSRMRVRRVDGRQQGTVGVGDPRAVDPHRAGALAQQVHVAAAQGLIGEALAGPGRLDQQVVAVALDLADHLDKGCPRQHLGVHHDPRVLVVRGEGLKLAQTTFHHGLGQLGAVQPLWVPVGADLFGDVQDGQARLIGAGYG